jgi:hemerythrin
MSTWQVESEKINKEHEMLHQQVIVTLAILTEKRSADERYAAIDSLRASLVDHFAGEEGFARAYDLDLFYSLHDSHVVLTHQFDQVKESLSRGDEAGARRLMAEFANALAQHDAEVDTPLLQIMGKGWAAGA